MIAIARFVFLLITWNFELRSNWIAMRWWAVTLRNCLLSYDHRDRMMEIAESRFASRALSSVLCGRSTWHSHLWINERTNEWTFRDTKNIQKANLMRFSCMRSLWDEISRKEKESDWHRNRFRFDATKLQMFIQKNSKCVKNRHWMKSLEK